MKFHDYLESVYTSSKLIGDKDYTTYRFSKTQAATKLIDLERFIKRQFAYVVLLTDFTLISVGLKKAPKTAHELLVDAQAKAQEAKRLEAEKRDLEASKQKVD